MGDAKRLTALEANRLRDKLCNAVNSYPKVFQTAKQWHESGFQQHTQGQVKRQLEILVRSGRIKVNRIYPGVYYGPLSMHEGDSDNGSS